MSIKLVRNNDVPKTCDLDSSVNLSPKRDRN